MNKISTEKAKAFNILKKSIRTVFFIMSTILLKKSNSISL